MFAARHIPVFVMVVLVSLAAGCGKDKVSLYDEGRALMEQGNYNGAIVHFKNALEKDPDFEKARFDLGRAYLEVGKLDRAEAEFKKARLLNPHDKRVSLHLGRIENFRNQPQKAREHLRVYMKEHPNDPAGYEQMAYAASIEGDPAESVEQLRKALELEPGRTEARLGLIHGLMSMGRNQEAERLVEKVLEKEPENRSALYAKAELKRQSQDMDGVLATYSRIGSIYHGDLYARYKEATILGDRGEVEQLGAIADKMIQEYPNKAEGHKLKGQYHYKKHDYDQAILSFQKAIKLDPDLESYYLLGLSYHYTGNLELAITQLNTVLDYSPEFLRAQVLLAEILVKQGRENEALKVIDELLAERPKDPAALALKGDALLGMGKEELALEHFEAAAGAAPDLYRLQLKKGMLRVAMGDRKRGEADLRRAVEMAPQALSPRLSLQALLAGQGRVEEAESVLREGLSGDKGDAVLYNAIARQKLGVRQTDAARKALEEAKEADPAYLPTYYGLATLHLAKGDKDAALAEYQAALAVDPDDFRARVGAAAALDASGNEELALEHLRQAATANGVRGIVMLAKFHLHNGQPQEAMKVLEQGLETYPDSTRLQGLKAEAHMVNGEVDQALAAYGRMEADNPWKGLLHKTRALAQAGRYDEALAVAEKLVAVSPDNPLSYLPLSIVHELRGNRSKSRKVLDQALDLDPDNVQVLTSVARLESMSGQRRAAGRTYERILDIDADNVEALTGLGVIRQVEGDSEGAVQAYRKALSLDQDHVQALNNLAMIYADTRGREMQAYNLAASAYGLAGGSPGVSDTLGYALLRIDRPGDALKLFEKARERSPDNPTIHYHMALALAELGDRDLALEKLNKALEHPEFSAHEDAGQLKRTLSGS